MIKAKIQPNERAMAGVLYRYLAKCTARLDHLLEQSVPKPAVIDVESYADFRKRTAPPTFQ